MRNNTASRLKRERRRGGVAPVGSVDPQPERELAEARLPMFEKRMVLITGGSGLIGTYLIGELLKRGAKVRAVLHRNPPTVEDNRINFVKGDLTNLEDCARVVKGVDYVIHAAAIVLGAEATANDPMQLIVPNVRMHTQMLEASCRENVEGFLFISSSTVYPPYDHPMKEEEGLLEHPYKSYFGIGWVKRFSELMAKFCHDDYGLRVAIVRPSNAYGRYDDFNFGTSHVIPALIRRAVERQDPYVVWGDGEEVRDVIHASDLARGLLLALEKYSIGEPINVGTGSEVKVKEMVPMILRLSGYRNANVQFDRSKPTMIPIRRLDVTKSREKLGFVPRVGLEEGLKDTIDWYSQTRYLRLR